MKDKFEQIIGKVESGHLEPKEAVDELLVLFDVVSTSNCDFCGSEIGIIRKVCHVCIDEMQDRD